MKAAKCCLAVLATPFLSGQVLAASELDLSISADSVATDYRLRDELRGTEWGVGALYNDDASAWLVSGTFNVVGEATQTDSLQTGLGVKAVVHDALETAGALAIGGSVQYQPQEFQGFGVEGQLYYAPSVLSVESERFFDVFARLTYEVHPQARVFVGWSRISVKYDDPVVPEVDLEDGFDLGFTLSF